MKYVILADANNVEPFIEPRQLAKINDEKLISRTIRLLKENGITDIMVTSHDKRFSGLGAKRYQPKNNSYKGSEQKGYWLDAFTTELITEPICFLLGDCYYSEKAIKTIVGSETESILYFCSYKNKDKRYIKHHDEPFGFKVKDTELFKEKIVELKKMYDEGKTRRQPIAWELYRLINGIEINTHEIKDNCIIINDESCDIDNVEDIELLEQALNARYIKVQVIANFNYKSFHNCFNIERVDKDKDKEGELYKGDKFDCTEEIYRRLSGDNEIHKKLVDLISIDKQ